MGSRCELTSELLLGLYKSVLGVITLRKPGPKPGLERKNIVGLIVIRLPRPNVRAQYVVVKRYTTKTQLKLHVKIIFAV